LSRVFKKSKGIKSLFDTFLLAVFYINNEGVESPFGVCSTNFCSRLARRPSGGPVRRYFYPPSFLSAGCVADWRTVLGKSS